jgi:hypothetical protein
MLFIESPTLPVFVTVTVWGGLVIPAGLTTWGANIKLAGETLISGWGWGSPKETAVRATVKHVKAKNLKVMEPPSWLLIRRLYGRHPNPRYIYPELTTLRCSNEKITSLRALGGETARPARDLVERRAGRD